jgi:hypothetical protein
MASFLNGEFVVVWDETVKIENKLSKKIGLQIRNAKGIVGSTRFITPDSMTAIYPVISVVNENTSVIAYSQKKGEKIFVAYQVVAID